jgi:hypothetical protein
MQTIVLRFDATQERAASLRGAELEAFLDDAIQKSHLGAAAAEARKEAKAYLKQVRCVERACT